MAAPSPACSAPCFVPITALPEPLSPVLRRRRRGLVPATLLVLVAVLVALFAPSRESQPTHVPQRVRITPAARFFDVRTSQPRPTKTRRKARRTERPPHR